MKGGQAGELYVVDPRKAYVRQVPGAVLKPPPSEILARAEPRRSRRRDAEVLGFTLDAPLADVEPLRTGMKSLNQSTREKMAEVAAKLWAEEAQPVKLSVQPLKAL